MLAKYMITAPPSLLHSDSNVHTNVIDYTVLDTLTDIVDVRSTDHFKLIKVGCDDNTCPLYYDVDRKG